MKNIALIFLALAFPCITFAAKILAYFPIAGQSHHFFYQPILRGLAQRGHQIDYYSPFPLKDPHENITHMPVVNLMEDALEEISLFDHWSLPILQQLHEFKQAGELMDTRLCQTGSIQDLLKSNSTYDLLLHESMYLHGAGLVFKHKFNVPSVMLGAVDDFIELNEFSGLLINPSYMVGCFSDHSDNMGFLERVHNSYLLAGALFLEYYHLRKLQKVVDECFIYPGSETRPPLSKLKGDQSLILVNNHPSVGFPFPRPPHVKPIGGAVVQRRKPLPQDLEDFINGAKDGVIYFSLGTIFDWERVDGKMKETFLKVFSKRKERVLWKLPNDPWESSSPPNVRISGWFPQQDVLAHVNVKLFITHGGLQSTFETVNYGVPVIVIPSFADQVRNSLAIVRHGYGVRLLLNNITETSVTWALNEVLYTPEYKEKILKGSELLKDRTMDPVDEGIYWIEYVLRHGNVLQPVGAHLDFIQRHCIDVIAFVLLVVLVIFFVTKRLISICYVNILLSVFDKLYKKKQD